MSPEQLTEELIRERLANAARDAGARPQASIDIATRVAKDHHAELALNGRIRLASGSTVADAIEALRLDLPHYFQPLVTTPSAASVKGKPATASARRKAATDKLALANGDAKPRLNSGADQDD